MARSLPTEARDLVTGASELIETIQRQHGQQAARVCAAISSTYAVFAAMSMLLRRIDKKAAVAIEEVSGIILAELCVSALRPVTRDDDFEALSNLLKQIVERITRAVIVARAENP